MPRDVSLSDSKCWNGGHEWVKDIGEYIRRSDAGMNVYLYIFQATEVTLIAI